jgi:hypothetical protein
MREIGGAIGVAAVSTVLVSRAGVNAFHAAFWVLFVVAALGALTAAVGFPRRTTQPSPSNAPIVSTSDATAVQDIDGAPAEDMSRPKA